MLKLVLVNEHLSTSVCSRSTSYDVVASRSPCSHRPNRSMVTPLLYYASLLVCHNDHCNVLSGIWSFPEAFMYSSYSNLTNHLSKACIIAVVFFIGITH
jgi:hypothetical protein